MEDQMKRKAIFQEEMEKLKQAGLLSDHEYEKVKEAHMAYYGWPESSTASVHEKSLDLSPKDAVSKPSKRPAVQRKVLTPEETRERNITWILIMGVIMVLLSGMILATSSWEVMNAATKTLLIGFIGLFFFGVSVTAERWLKIYKTSYAFWILGSLFLPAAILSAGFFGLLGPWLSITGEGRFLLGVIGASVCLPVYVASSAKYHSRLFVWLSLVTLSVDICFLIASFHVPVDGFFFGIVLYNSLLITAYMALGKRWKDAFFIRELPLFIQVNLIISTLFMLGIFQDYRFYGFNVILTAVLYCFMIFYQGSKEYSYVFGILLVYGIYQVVEHTPVGSMDMVLYALVGFIFLGFEFVLKKEKHIKGIFRYMSGFVSFFAFVYISVKGIELRAQHSSWIMLVSYLFIAVNYLYLSYKTGRWVFAYLAPVFLLSAAYQGYRLIQSFYEMYPYSIHMFASALLIFILLYHQNRWRFLQTVRRSSGFLSLLAMLYAILDSVNEEKWIIASAFLILYGILFLVVYKGTGRKFVKELCRWVIPAAWFFGLLLLFGEIQGSLDHQKDFYDFPLHAGLSAAGIFILHGIWRKDTQGLRRSFFWAAHGFLLVIIPLTQIYFEFFRYKFPAAYLIFMGIYVYSMIVSGREWLKRLFLYGAFTMLPLVYHAVFQRMDLMEIWQNHLMLITSLSIGVFWVAGKAVWKRRIAYYLIPFSILGASMINGIPGYTIIDFSLLVFYVMLILFLNHKSRLQVINILPLGILLGNLLILDDQVFHGDKAPMLYTLLLASLILRAAGEILHKRLYHAAESQKGFVSIDFDWYSIVSWVCIFLSFSFIPPRAALVIRLSPHILFFGWFLSQTGRLGEGIPKRIGLTMTALSFFVPYYQFLDEIGVPRLFLTELKSLPWLVLCIGLRKKIWRENDHVMKKIELGILLVVSMVLFREVLLTGSIYEGLMMGSLSLAAVLIGMHIRVKFYFFIGIADLLLNVLLLTRGFWQSIPWWGYLLGAGLILIITASISEMKKNGKGKKFLKLSKEDVAKRFDGWK